MLIVSHTIVSHTSSIEQVTGTCDRNNKRLNHFFSIQLFNFYLGLPHNCVNINLVSTERHVTNDETAVWTLLENVSVGLCGTTRQNMAWSSSRKSLLILQCIFGMLSASVLPKINQHSLNEMLNSSFLLCEVYNSNHDCDVWLCLGSCHMIQ